MSSQLRGNAGVALGKLAGQARRFERRSQERRSSLVTPFKQTGCLAVSSFLLVLGFCVAFRGFDASCQQALNSAMTERDERLDFLQSNFARFVPVLFQKGTNSEAAIQRLHVHENLFEYKGQHYCGFRFSTPSWLDGDLSWIHWLAKTNDQTDFLSSGNEWYIIPETGHSGGFEDFSVRELSKYPALKAQFPYTRAITIQHCDLTHLVPGKTYAIWFGFKEKEVPDLFFAMTIRSDRGEDEFGALPLR